MEAYESWDYEEHVANHRWLYLAGGSLLVWLGLRRWSIPAAIVTGAGAMLVQRGLEGRADEIDELPRPRVRRTRGNASFEPARTFEEPDLPGRSPGSAVRDAAIYESDVDESSDESFPASDPPSWTPVTGAGPTHG